MCKLGINSHSQIYSYSLRVVYECNFKMCDCRRLPKHSASMPATIIKIMSRMTIEGASGGEVDFFRCVNWGYFVVDVLSIFDYIYGCAYLFIDAAASINRWPHLFIDGRIYL